MTYSPIHVGDTGATLAPEFLYDNGAPVSLSGATINMKLININDPSIIKTCSPSNWIVDDAANGKAHYQYQSSDVDTAGLWRIDMSITMNGKPIHGDDGNRQDRILEILTP